MLVSAGRPPSVTDFQRNTIAGAKAKGPYGMLLLAAIDLEGVFQRLQTGDADVVQEPTQQPYGVRDCAVHEAADNLVRVQELSGAEGGAVTGGPTRSRESTRWSNRLIPT